LARLLPPLVAALLLAAGARAEEPQPAASPVRLPVPSPEPGDAAKRFPRDERQRLPRPSDVWSLVREVPGVVTDRVNVGGSETGLQSIVVSGGDGGSGAVFTIDGADVTDPAALGSAAIFPDLELAGDVQVRTRSQDVRVRSAGAHVDVVLRELGIRGFQGEAHVRGGFDALQSDNLPRALAGRPFFRSRTDRQLELGAEAGGTPRGGRLWLWGGVSRNALRQEAFTEHEETLAVTTFAAKALWHGQRTALALTALRNEKVHDGRDTSLTASPEARWRQSGPNHLLSLQADRTWGGGSSALARVSYLDGGFRLDGAGGPDANVLEDFRGVLRGSYYAFRTERPRLSASLEARGRRRALGFGHSWLAGASYRRSAVLTTLSWPGNQVLALERQSVFFRTFGLTGFALPYRDQDGRTVEDGAGLFAQDELERGRFTVSLGARLDRQGGHSQGSSVAANPVVPELLPAVAFAGTDARFTWTDVLPRASVAYALGGAADARVRASYAAYGPWLGAGDAAFDNPIGREAASVTYYWLDRNGDHAVQADELDLVNGRLGSSGMDPRDPASVASPNAVDPAYRSPRTHELSGAVESGVGFGVRATLAASWRRHVRLRWTPLRNLTTADYVIRGAVQGALFGDAYSVGFYAPASESKIVPGNGRLLTNRDGYRQESGTVELTLRGRPGARVLWTAWGAWADWREYFDDRGGAVQDPTSLEAEPLQDGGRVVVRAGGFGRSDLFVHARWNAGATADAALPKGFRAALVLNARDGFPIPYFMVGNSGDVTGAAKNVLVASRVDRYRLPAVVLLDARLSRAFAIRRGTLTASVDAFNLLDRATALQVSRDVELPVFARPRELMRPRIVRLGLAYAF
jgi:hypothetical protein